MFEASEGAHAVSETAALRSWLTWLGGPVGEGDDGDLLGQVELLERVKGACAARQARLSVAFDEGLRAQQRAQGVPAHQVGRGVAEQIALARRESPTQGSRHLGLAKALVREMPHTLSALGEGHISEWTATVAVRETACLAADDRRQVDAELADRLSLSSPAQVRRQAWAAACRLDPQAAVHQHARAVSDRCVSVRPAPDAMTYLTALLPVQEGVAAYAALATAAGSARAIGDPRSRGQVMADELVARLTGSAQAASAVEVCVVLTDETLLGEGQEPALVTTTDASGSNPAGGLVPAAVARDLVRDAARAWVRRLYVHPKTGELVAMESTRRKFEGNLRRMLVLRDQRCRTPHALVRGADPARRPRASARRRRIDRPGQRARTVRALQPDEEPSRLARPDRAGRPRAARANDDTDRPHLRLHRPALVEHRVTPRAASYLAVVSDDLDEPSVRLTAFVRGDVQGVGFRWWTRARALELGLVGHATNLPDGRVQVVTEGRRAACARLLEQLVEQPSTHGRPGAVTGVSDQWTTARGTPSGFVER